MRREKENRLVSSIRAIGLIRGFAVLAVAVVGGWLAAVLAVSGVTRIKSPQTALMLLPSDSVALAARADQVLFANPAKPPPETAMLARAALKQQALNAKAIRILGYLAEANGDRREALALIKMAARLSRREPGAQLWLIEFYALESDIKKTLGHYDILLTTKPDAQVLLFPRLLYAIEDATVRAALIPYLRQDKSWTSSFLWHAINNNEDLTNVVHLILEARGFPKTKSDKQTSREQERTLINRLVGENRFVDARRMYALMPNASPALLTNPDFTEEDRDGRFGSMSWRIPDDPNASGSFVNKEGQRKPALSIFVSSATTRTVASRLLYLQAGTYRLNVKFSQFERGDGGFVQFQIRCPNGTSSAPIWIFTVYSKRSVGKFDVPINCPTQFLDIVASGGKAQLGLEATIDSVSITQ